MPYKASFLIWLQVLMESFDRFFEFVRRSNAVSPTVALETANALQVSMSIS
jgi:vacuolar protein sorting-associated protein 13A/C